LLPRLPDTFDDLALTAAPLAALPSRFAFAFASMSSVVSALITGLLKVCLDHGCVIEPGVRVTELLPGPDGRIEGLVSRSGDKPRFYRATKGVVIASGGFEWNVEMRNSHFPGHLDWLGSPRPNEGDGHRMVAAVGGQLARMDQANVYPAIPTVYEGQPHGLPVIFQAEKHAIVVNSSARRFVSEYDFNIGVALDRRAPTTGLPENLPAWVIADCRLLKDALHLRFYSGRSPNWLIRANSIRELAGKIGVSADALEETIACYNRFCAQGCDLDFQRGESAGNGSRQVALAMR